MRPDINNLVVLFPLSNETFRILTVDLHNLVLGLLHDVPLVTGDYHVVDGDGETAHGGVAVSDVLKTVSKKNGGLGADVSVRKVDEIAAGPLVHHLVDHGEGDTRTLLLAQEDVKTTGGFDGLA